MAINCLVMPVAGRPTRRICLSCSLDTSGVSEKSICESGVCHRLFPTRLPGTDVADDFIFSALPPQCVDHEQDALSNRTQRESSESGLVPAYSNWSSAVPVSFLAFAVNCRDPIDRVRH